MNANRWAEFVTLLVRRALLIVLAPFVSHGIVDQALLDRLLFDGSTRIVAVLAVCGLVIWSMRSKVWNIVLLHLAHQAPPGAPITEVHSDAKELGIVGRLSLAFMGR